MKAMLLAAGLGSRMRPLTDHTPKPLLPVAGKPLLAWHLEKLAAAGFVDVVINCAWLGEQIEQFVGDGAQFGLRVQISREQTPLETGGGIFRALPLLGDEPFVVISSDVWSDYPLARLLSVDTRCGHLVMVDNPAHLTGGDFSLAANGLLNERGDGAKVTYSGIAVLHPDFFHGCTDGVFALRSLMVRAMAQQALTGEHYRGEWLDVGTPERLREAERLALRRQ
jgi:MurNAc alpha-1-phosphate uridylyltransferase